MGPTVDAKQVREVLKEAVEAKYGEQKGKFQASSSPSLDVDLTDLKRWIIDDSMRTYCNVCGTPGHSRVICPLKKELRCLVVGMPNGKKIWEDYQKGLLEYKKETY